MIRALVSPDSFGSILVLLMVTYALAVTANTGWGHSLVLVVQVTTVGLVLRVSQARRSVRLLAGVAVMLAGVVAVASLFGTDSDGLEALVFGTSAFLYLIAPVAVLRALVLSGDVDRETVFGALDAYILIGLFFAFAYRMVGAIQSSPFFGSAGDGKLPQDLFFSFTTLTTTGYGNLVPAGNPGQTMAVLEMLVGQLFLVTAVAKVINAWHPKRWRALDEGTPE